MKTILVSGSSGIVGYGVLRSLRRAGRDFKLIGTTIYDDSVAEGFCDVFEKAPLTSDPAYLEWLVSMIGKHRIDLLIPCIEADLYKWSDHAAEIESQGARVLLNNPELVRLCKDKWTFFDYLNSFQLPCVIDSAISGSFAQLRTRFGLPFLLKPRRGYGSRGLVRVDSEESFAAHSETFGSELLAQPIVGNEEEEFTTAAFGDGRGGYFSLMTLKRKLSKDGFTDRADVVNESGIVETVGRLCEIFRPLGPTNFQFRKHGGVMKLLEINPRISSSTSIRASFGYNESLMAVEYFLENKPVTQPQIRPGRAVRYVEDFIFYEDRPHL